MRALDPIWGLCSSGRTGIMMAWSAKVKPFSWLSVQERAYWTKLMPQSQPFANCLWKTSDANDVRAMSFVSHYPLGIGYVCAVLLGPCKRHSPQSPNCWSCCPLLRHPIPMTHLTRTRSQHFGDSLEPVWCWSRWDLDPWIGWLSETDGDTKIALRLKNGENGD